MVFAKFLSFLSGNNNNPKRITDEENGRRREPNNQAQGGGGRGQNGGQQPHAGSVGARVQAPAAPGQAPAGNANTQLQLMNRLTTQEVGGQRNGQNEEQQVVRGGSAAPKPKAKEEQKLSKSRTQEEERARKAEEQQKRKAEKEAKLQAELKEKRDKAERERREREDQERRRREDDERRRQEAKDKRENAEREKREKKDRELRAKEDKERAKREDKDRREAEERARRERAETEKREKKEQELRDKQELKRRKQEDADRRVREEKERREREEAEKRERKQKAADARKKSPSFGFSRLADKPNVDHAPDRVDAATGGGQDPSRPAGSPEAILFYEKDEPYYEFTNFAPYSVEYKGKIYPTSEHLFQAYKFMETQPDIAERIRLAPNPRTAFQEAGKLRGMQRSDWYKINISVMEMIVELKFTQHSILYDMLLSTGNKDIVEASPIDAFWGYGPDGKGRNELGKILVRVRDRLREDMLKQGTGSRPQSMQRLEGGSQSAQNGEGPLDYPSVPPKSGSEKALGPTSKASRASIVSTKDVIHRTSTPAPRPDSPIEFYDRGKPYYEFTNFSDHPIVFEGKVYPTSEHLFQAHKFLGHAPNHAEHIRIQPTSRLALQEATNLRQHQRPDWFKVNISCMDFVLEQKFTQHPELRDLLLSTGDKVLVEASPIDAFWGYGQDGRGRNELGKALMRLRTKFREADARVAAAEATATTSNGGVSAHSNNGHAKSPEEARTKTPSPVHRRPLPVPPSSSSPAPAPPTEKVPDAKPPPPTSPKPPPKSANRASATPIADKFATSPTLGAASPARSVASPSTKHAPLPTTPEKAPPAGKPAAPAQPPARAQTEAPPSPNPTARKHKRWPSLLTSKR